VFKSTIYSLRQQPKQGEQQLHPSAKFLLLCGVIVFEEMLKLHGLSAHNISCQCCQDLWGWSGCKLV